MSSQVVTYAELSIMSKPWGKEVLVLSTHLLSSLTSEMKDLIEIKPTQTCNGELTK